jgi:hypothetical protein
MEAVTWIDRRVNVGAGSAVGPSARPHAVNADMARAIQVAIQVQLPVHLFIVRLTSRAR